MARLHTRKKGKSGSRRPTSKAVPAWADYSKDDVQEIIVKLAKEGKNADAIGQTLRDTYGIPKVKAIAGKTIGRILFDNKLLPEYPHDMINLIKRVVKMREHLKKHKRDGTNVTKLTHVESKIKRLVYYYRKSGRLPKDWEYDPDTAALLVK